MVGRIAASPVSWPTGSQVKTEAAITISKPKSRSLPCPQKFQNLSQICLSQVVSKRNALEVTSDALLIMYVAALVAQMVESICNSWSQKIP